MLKDAKGELELQKWQKQLEIISNIHKLQDKIIKILNRMPIVIDIKTDLRYQQGAKEGLEQGLEQGLDIGRIEQATITVINMLLETDFSIKRIAEIAAVKFSFVAKWKKELSKFKIKATWNSFDVGKDDKKIIVKRAESIAINLVKIEALSDEIIAKICELKLAKVTKIRLTKKKKETNGNGKSVK